MHQLSLSGTLKSFSFIPPFCWYVYSLSHQVLPLFFHVMRTCDLQRRQFLFQQLGVLVSIIKNQIKDYLAAILQLIHEYWDTSLIQQVRDILFCVSS